MAWKTTAAWTAGLAGAVVAAIVVVNLIFTPNAPEGHYAAIPQTSTAPETVAPAPVRQAAYASDPARTTSSGIPAEAGPDSQEALAWQGVLTALGVQAKSVKAEPGRLIFTGLTFADKKGDIAEIGRAELEGLEPVSLAALLGQYDGLIAQRATFSGIVLKKENGERVDAGKLVLTRPYYRADKSGVRVFRSEEIRLSGGKAVDKGIFAGSVEEIRIANAGVEFGADGKGALLLSQDPALPPSISIKNFSAPARHASDEAGNAWQEALGIDMVTGSLEVSYAPGMADETVRDLLVSVNLADMADLDLKTSIAPRKEGESWLRLSGDDADQRKIPDVMFHGFSLSYHDHSLMRRILDHVGREQGKSGDEVAQEVSLMAAFLTMAAGEDGAAKLEPLTRSLSEFLRKPGRFSVSIEPVEPIALAELSGKGGIKPDIIKRLRIKASAGEP